LRASQAWRERGYEGREEAAVRTSEDDSAWREVCAVLDEELLRLPEKYRAPLLLCYLEGLTREEAARRLGLSLNRLRGRLDYGRGLLRGRLTRRGVGLPAALLAGLLAREAAAAGPAPLAVTTVRAAARAAVGALTEGLVRTMLRAKLNVVCA